MLPSINVTVFKNGSMCNAAFEGGVEEKTELYIISLLMQAIA